VTWPSKKPEETEFVFALTVQAPDPTTPVSGIQVDACDPFDPSCNPPHFGSYKTDLYGNVLLSFKGAQNYPGPLSISGKGFVPSLHYFVPPLATSVKGTLFLSTPTSLQEQSASSGVILDPERGQLFVPVADCAQKSAAGISISISPSDEKTRVVYLGSDPGRTSTDLGGGAAVLNVKPGEVTVEASFARTCERVAVTQVWIRKGTVTILPLPPTPL